MVDVCSRFKPQKGSSKCANCNHRAKSHNSKEKEPEPEPPKPPPPQGISDYVARWQRLAKAKDKEASAETNAGLRSKPGTAGKVVKKTEKSTGTRNKAGGEIRMMSSQRKRKDAPAGTPAPSAVDSAAAVKYKLACSSLRLRVPLAATHSEIDAMVRGISTFDTLYTFLDLRDPGGQHWVLATVGSSHVIRSHAEVTGDEVDEMKTSKHRIHLALTRKIPSHIMQDLPSAIRDLEDGEKVDEESEDEAPPRPTRAARKRSRRHSSESEEAEETEEQVEDEKPKLPESLDDDDDDELPPVEDLPVGGVKHVRSTRSTRRRSQSVINIEDDANEEVTMEDDNNSVSSIGPLRPVSSSPFRGYSYDPEALPVASSSRHISPRRCTVPKFMPISPGLDPLLLNVPNPYEM
uniref:Uncharacterized protein n=1 Tax=Mycena chlorophos TaxID=658473 RepID=A0ABQ0KUC3_MYCCL|nr:predicted protein [Mycena chlorophos]